MAESGLRKEAQAARKVRNDALISPWTEDHACLCYQRALRSCKCKAGVKSFIQYPSLSYQCMVALLGE
jgi:hypothetical protein